MWYSKAFSCNCGSPHSSSSFVHLLLPLLLLLLLLLSPLLRLLLLLLLPLLLLFEPLLLDLLSLLRDLFLSFLFLIGLGEADLKSFKGKARFDQFWDHEEADLLPDFPLLRLFTSLSSSSLSLSDESSSLPFLSHSTPMLSKNGETSTCLLLEHWNPHYRSSALVVTHNWGWAF